MEIIFHDHPDVIIGGNVFRNVPTIIQFEDTPLLEVTQAEPAGFSTRFAVYHPDGTKIAVVKGSRIHLTEAGKKAKINARFEANLTACELEGRTILELRRQGAAALKGWAELHAPEGVLVRALDSGVAGLLSGGSSLAFANMMMKNSIFDGCQIGIHVTRTKIALGQGGSVKIGYLGPTDGSQLVIHVEGDLPLD